jgi:hypothetical protein
MLTSYREISGFFLQSPACSLASIWVLESESGSWSWTMKDFRSHRKELGLGFEPRKDLSGTRVRRGHWKGERLT